MASTALAIVVAVVVASLVDWLFGGVLFHDKYLEHPEVWRNPRGGSGETRAVAISAAIAVVTPVVFVWLCHAMGLSRRGIFQLAIAVWLIAPLPMLVTQHQFVRMHPLITTTHLTGWLVKLLGCAAIAAWLL